MCLAHIAWLLIVAVVLSSCDNGVSGGYIYGKSCELEHHGDFVLEEIAKQNPTIRKLVHITEYDYLHKKQLTSRIRREYPDALVRKAKMSYLVLLILPGDFSFTPNDRLSVKDRGSSQSSTTTATMKQLLLDSGAIKDASWLNDIKYDVSYKNTTSAAFYFVDVYKLSVYSLVLIRISRRGEFSNLDGEYQWSPNTL